MEILQCLHRCLDQVVKIPFLVNNYVNIFNVFTGVSLLLIFLVHNNVKLSNVFTAVLKLSRFLSCS